MPIVNVFCKVLGHTGLPETTSATERITNATEINKQSKGIKYLSRYNLPRISLIRGKLFPDIYNIFPPVDYNCV